MWVNQDVHYILAQAYGTVSSFENTAHYKWILKFKWNY